MITVTLRSLLREPNKVKRIIRVGHSVRVTEHGRPLWLIKPVPTSDNFTESRRGEIDAILDEVLSKRPLSTTLSAILEKSRR
jgi:hypothetical protein